MPSISVGAFRVQVLRPALNCLIGDDLRQYVKRQESWRREHIIQEEREPLRFTPARQFLKIEHIVSLYRRPNRDWYTVLVKRKYIAADRVPFRRGADILLEFTKPVQADSEFDGRELL